MEMGRRDALGMVGWGKGLRIENLALACSFPMKCSNVVYSSLCLGKKFILSGCSEANFKKMDKFLFSFLFSFFFFFFWSFVFLGPYLRHGSS